MRIHARIATWLLVAGLGGLGLGGGAAPAGAEELEENGTVVSKDLARGTLMVDGELLSVNAGTVIEDLQGRAITLADVPVQGDPPFSMGQEEPGAVAYDARRTADGWVVTRMRLMEAIPR